MAIESFKNYQRSARVQLPEELYNKGMQYTDAPLSSGFCKTLVNFDLKDNGEVLTPRPGLKNIDFVDYTTPPGIPYTDGMMLENATEIIESEDNNTKYQLFIVGDVYHNALHAITNYTGEQYSAIIKNLSFQAHFKSLYAGDAHGVSTPNMKYLSKNIGTFAFNNSYYFFDNVGLNHTKFGGVGQGYIAEAVTPRSLTPSEAVMWGYNMLRTNPYTFQNTMLGVDSPITLDGVLPYDQSNNLMLSPQVNQVLHFECFYKGYPGKTYTVKWEWKEGGSSIWTELKTETFTVSDVARLLCNFNVPSNSIILRVTATNTGTPTDLQVMTIGFEFGKATQGNALNSKQVSYDLKNSSCMTYWKNRLVLAYNNLLFLSEINDPSYFPYPNNMEPFPENITHIMSYLDSLLVFTTSKLYTLTLNTDGLSWYVKCIQNNLNINPADTHLIQIVKNMVFFKSGNYYYMVVPKASSTTGELTIAPVSRPMELFFNNFGPEIDKLLKTVYDYTDGTELLYYQNFLDFEDVHNIYTFSTSKNVMLNVDLLYNTVLRVWRIYCFESSHIIKPFKPDATTKGTFMSLYYRNTVPCVQLLRFVTQANTDSYLTSAGLTATITFKNYQFLDTGYREISSNLKKRFREAQIKLNNRSGVTLNFYTEFYVDGDSRKVFYKYTPIQNTDPASPNYGFLTMERELIDPSILPGTTVLAETQDDLNCWTLDVTPFMEASIWKIRVPFSGKGYAPRMLLLSFNEEPYEILNNVWVYRQLYSR
jgi:hypothetical protein